MLVQIVTENGQKKTKPLTADAGAGAPVGTVIAMYKKSNPSGFLYLDGRDTTGTSEELSTHYPLLYAYLGSNVLPDYREFALVGAEENTTDVYNASTNPTGTIHDHDVYAEGEAKDDCIQDFNINISTEGTNYNKLTKGSNTSVGTAKISEISSEARAGTSTHGKRKAVYFYIKATSGLSENAQDNVVAQLNEERSYSTEEVNTGKKWIDGKPIYRRVFEYNNITITTFSGVDLDSNFPISQLNIISLSGVGYKTNQTMVTMPTFYVNNNVLGVVESISSSTYNYKVVVEYTKTTD